MCTYHSSGALPDKLLNKGLVLSFPDSSGISQALIKIFWQSIKVSLIPLCLLPHIMAKGYMEV